VDLRVFRRGGFWVVSIDRGENRATERTGGAVFERLKKGKLMISGGCRYAEPFQVTIPQGFCGTNTISFDCRPVFLNHDRRYPAFFCTERLMTIRSNQRGMIQTGLCNE